MFTRVRPTLKATKKCYRKSKPQKKLQRDLQIQAELRGRNDKNGISRGVRTGGTGNLSFAAEDIRYTTDEQYIGMKCGISTAFIYRGPLFFKGSQS